MFIILVHLKFTVRVQHVQVMWFPFPMLKGTFVVQA